MSSLGMQILKTMKPLMAVLPEVQTPIKKVPFREKVLWTAITLFSFFDLLSNPAVWNSIK